MRLKYIGEDDFGAKILITKSAPKLKKSISDAHLVCFHVLISYIDQS